MKEKILALLLAKFAGVRKDGLARMAGVLSLQAANEQEAGTLVEKLTTEKVNEFITDYRKDVDKEISDATKTHEKTLKTKFDFVEKKDQDQTTDPPKKPEPNDIAAIIAQAVKAAVEPLQQKFSALENQKTSEIRLQQLEGKYANVPDSYKAQRIADAKLFIGNMDETAFTEYLTRTEGDITAFNQELANRGLAGQTKPIFGNSGANEEDSFIQSMKDINKVEEKK